MLCNTCAHKSFCKHYEYIVNTHCLKIILDECDNYQKKYIVNKAIDTLATQTAPIDNKTHTAFNSDTLFGGKIYPDLKEEYKPSTVTELATPIEISKVICDRCKKEVNSTEIDNCVECGRPVCRDCGVGALNNGKPEFTCEKCWSGTPDPDPNVSEEVIITYGEEKAEWDITDFEDVTHFAKEDLENESTEREQVGNKTSTRKSKKK